MDIDYLLLLQNFREATGDALSGLMVAVSDISIGFIPLAMMCLVYWVFDRRAGRRILAGFSCGLLVNGFLKLVCCIYRPWIRDARVLPYGDSKVSATGYSFPSGHSTFATASVGGIGAWLWRGARRVLACLCFLFVAIVMFSRNYLGVHTPQDVLVGFGATALVMVAVSRLEDWTDADPRRDLVVLAGGLALCAVLAFFYFVKPYPLDYLPDGSLLVDPAKMRADSFEGIGLVASFVVCRYFERRGFAFDERLAFGPRLACGIVALVPLAAWMAVAYPALKAVDPLLGKFVGFGVLVAYVLLLVPAAMGVVARHLERRGDARA